MDEKAHCSGDRFPLGEVDGRGVAPWSGSNEVPMPVRVWEGARHRIQRPATRGYGFMPILQVQAARGNKPAQWDDAGMARMAVDASSVRSGNQRCQELLRPWHLGLRGVDWGRRLRALLGPRRASSVAGTFVGPHRQRPGLRAGQRPVGDVAATTSESSRQSHGGGRRGVPLHRRMVGALWCRPSHHSCQAQRWMGCEAGRVRAGASKASVLITELVF